MFGWKREMNSWLAVVLKENCAYFNITIHNIILYGTIIHVEYFYKIQYLLYEIKWLWINHYNFKPLLYYNNDIDM